MYTSEIFHNTPRHLSFQEFTAEFLLFLLPLVYRTLDQKQDLFQRTQSPLLSGN